MTHRFFFTLVDLFFSSTLKAFLGGKGKGKSREAGLLFMHFLLFLFNKSKVIKVRLENINFHFEKGTASEENPR